MKHRKPYARLRTFGVNVEHRPDLKTLGHWDERDGTIRLRDDPKSVGGGVVLVHEAMHLAESVMIQRGIIKRRAGEPFVTHAAPVVLYALASVGLLKGITEADVDRFMRKGRDA